MLDVQRGEEGEALAAAAIAAEGGGLGTFHYYSVRMA
jgi:hypothetical protein